MALLLTVGSNLLGIFTMPFVLSAVLGAVSGSVKIAPKPLLQSLLKTILVPLLIGASARALIPGSLQFSFSGLAFLSCMLAKDLPKQLELHYA